MPKGVGAERLFCPVDAQVLMQGRERHITQYIRPEGQGGPVSTESVDEFGRHLQFDEPTLYSGATLPFQLIFVAGPRRFDFLPRQAP
jgi:hypothetical protein